MKKILVCLLSFIVAASAVSSAQNLTITIKGIQPSAGKVKISLFDEEGFLRKAISSKEVSIDTYEATVIFEKVPSGRYALSAVQDTNSNGMLDFSEMGVPVEPFGLSGTQGFIMGIPSFKEVAFDLEEDTIVTLYLVDMSDMF